MLLPEKQLRIEATQRKVQHVPPAIADVYVIFSLIQSSTVIAIDLKRYYEA